MAEELIFKGPFNPNHSDFTTLLLYISTSSHCPLPSTTLHITQKSHINTKQENIQISQFYNQKLITLLFLFTLNLATPGGELEYDVTSITQTNRCSVHSSALQAFLDKKLKP